MDIESRYKIWRVGQRELFDFLTRDGTDIIAVPTLPKEFEGAKVMSPLSVHYESAYRAFSVLLWRADWPVVSDGARIPVIDSHELNARLYRQDAQGRYVLTDSRDFDVPAPGKML